MAVTTQSSESMAQSRVGKRPVQLPKGVEVNIRNGQVSVKGPKGALQRKLAPMVKVECKEGKVLVTPLANTGRDGKRFQGLMRALISGMVEGVSKGFETTLVLYGVGYRMALKDKELTMTMGFSHPVVYPLPSDISAEVETVEEAGVKRMRIKLHSHNKELLGLTAARLRAFKPPEPYKGKGLRFLGEKVREKAGKAAGVGKTT